jgi:hypothetical protein
MKKFSRFSQIMTLMFALVAISFACVDDDYDKPVVPQIPVGTVYTIEQVKGFFNTNGGTYTFTEDASVYATVTMDNETDNSYRHFLFRMQQVPLQFIRMFLVEFILATRYVFI